DRKRDVRCQWIPLDYALCTRGGLVPAAGETAGSPSSRRFAGRGNEPAGRPQRGVFNTKPARQPRIVAPAKIPHVAGGIFCRRAAHKVLLGNRTDRGGQEARFLASASFGNLVPPGPPGSRSSKSFTVKELLFCALRAQRNGGDNCRCRSASKG